MSEIWSMVIVPFIYSFFLGIPYIQGIDTPSIEWIFPSLFMKHKLRQSECSDNHSLLLMEEAWPTTGFMWKKHGKRGIFSISTGARFAYISETAALATSDVLDEAFKKHQDFSLWPSRVKPFFCVQYRWYRNMDTQNDGLEKVTPLKNCNFWYLC